MLAGRTIKECASAREKTNPLNKVRRRKEISKICWKSKLVLAVLRNKARSLFLLIKGWESTWTTSMMRACRRKLTCAQVLLLSGRRLDIVILHFIRR